MANTLNALLKGTKIDIELDVNEGASLSNINRTLNTLEPKLDNLKVGIEIKTTVSELATQIKNIQTQLNGAKGAKALQLKVEIDKMNMADFNTAISEIQKQLKSRSGTKALVVDLEVDVKGAGAKLKKDLDELYVMIRNFNKELSTTMKMSGGTGNAKALADKRKLIQGIITQQEKLNKLEKESYENEKNSASLNSAKKHLEEAQAKAQNAKNTQDLETATEELNEAMKEMSQIRKNNMNMKDQANTAKLAEDARRYAIELKKATDMSETEYKQLLETIENTSTKGSGAMKQFTDNIKVELSSAKNTINEMKSSFTDLTEIANRKGLKEGMFNAVNNEDIISLKNYIGVLKEGEVRSINLSDEMNDLNGSFRKLSGTIDRGDGSLENFQMEMRNTDGSIRQTKKSISTAKGEFEGFFGKLRQAFSQIPAWSIIVEGMQLVQQAARETVTQIFEVNKAMTEIRKVASDGINADTLLRGTLKQSIDLGSDLNNMLDSLAEVARTYDDLNESQLMAVNSTATIMANVSDLEVPEAMESLIGTMNAFKIEAEESITVVDKLNEVDNQYAISTKQLATGLQKASATAEVFGVSIDELVGQITGIGAVTMESGEIIGKQVAV